MMSKMIPLMAAVACATFAMTARAQHSSRQVLLEKEAALPEGVLPAWQTTREREEFPRSLRLDIAPSSPLPPPPATGYRAPAEFEHQGRLQSG